jgi:general secretion pathway protein L
VAAGDLVSLLRIFLPPLAGWTPLTPLVFAVLGAQRRVVREGKAPLAECPKADRVELVLAAQDVLLTLVKLPRLSGARLRSALPNLLEEKLLTEVDDVFVALGPAEGAGERKVAVVQKEPLQRLLAACRKAGLAVTAAYPVSLTNPIAPRQWGCVLTPDAAWVRGDATSALLLSPPSSPGEVPVELVLALGRVAEQPERLVVDGPADLAVWGQVLGLPVAAGSYDRLGFETPSLNLLQFELAPDVLDWKAWRWAAVFAAAAAVVAILGLNLQWWQLGAEKKALQARMEKTYRTAFPEATAVVNPLLQMRRQIADLRVAGGSANPDDFLPLANALGNLLQETPNPVRSLEYRDGQLRLRFAPALVDNAAKREALATRLRGGGFTVQFNNDESALVKRTGP